MAELLNKPCACPEVVITHNEEDTGLIVTASLPGVEKKDVELTVGSHNFCITGEREDLRFEGCYQLVHDVVGDNTDAEFKNGLLTLKIPFKEPLLGKKIVIH
jgi:HSP20 family molecular chaperone IbpA